MLSSKRFDAFPRGVHEAYKELKNRQFEHSELAIEQNICIYYPLPKFLYTSKNSILLHERISKGLNMMLEDGSFDKIWKEYNYDYVLNAKLNSRKIFKLENPFLPDTVPLNNNELWFSIE